MFKLALLSLCLFSYTQGKLINPPTQYQRYESCIGTVCQANGTSCQKSSGFKSWGYSSRGVFKATSLQCYLPDGSSGESSLCCDQGSEEGEWIVKKGARPNEFPFVASLVSDYSQIPSMRGKGEYCTGSIYNKEYILTAAHCVKLDNIVAPRVLITLGATHQLTDPVYDERFFISTSDDIIIYEGYTYGSSNHDVALIKLPTPIKNFNEYVQPIRIAKDGEDYLSSEIGIPLGYGIGPWGYSPNAIWGWPMKLTKPLSDRHANQDDPITVQYCDRMLGATATQDDKDQRICVGGYGDGGVGEGHSGGPMVCMDKAGKPYQCGISSNSNRGCAIQNLNCKERGDWPSVYSNVAYYNKWIMSKTGKRQSSREYMKQLKYPYVDKESWFSRGTRR